MPSKKKRIMNEDLKTLIDRLPPEMEPELREHIEGLLKRERGGRKRRLRLDWAGGLKEYRDRYTSLSLQKTIL
jgi:hypothetical protein